MLKIQRFLREKRIDNIVLMLYNRKACEMDKNV